ncbi:MAG TPA: hypothetical protein VFQ41_02185 [Candidatus Angelobacter sp.]|nr:hypothetical protein [Candidatus Angelobacter sp.]
MNTLRFMAMMVLSAALACESASAQQPRLSDNAALRYWSAFAQMQDTGITEQQAKEAHAILDGTAPYDDSKYKDLTEKNRPAVETMARGTALPYCDWGVEIQLGDKAPVDYARKAALLGRLNVFYAFHLVIAGDKDGAVRALQAGLRFSHDVANGGTLFATVVAQGLIIAHLQAVSGIQHVSGFSSAQRAALQKSIEQLGSDGLDWTSAMKREMQVLPTHDAQGVAALDKIAASYVRMLSNPGTLPDLQQTIRNAPKQIADLIPNPKRVLDEKQDLTDRLQQVRSLLR